MCIVADVPIEPAVLWGASGPFFGSLICLALAWTQHFSLVTGEPLPPHCPPNATLQVPSLSMAIGVYKPNKFIWLFFIVLHFVPRPFLGVLYKMLFDSTTTESRHYRVYRTYGWLLSFHYYAMMVGCLILSIVDINEDFRIHCLGFVIWLWSSCFVMATNTGLHHFSGWRNVSRRNEIMLWVKLATTLFQISAALSILYIYPVIFVRDCHVFGHTIFSLLEYSLVFLNVCFCFYPLIEFPGLRLGMYIDFSAMYERGSYPTRPPSALNTGSEELRLLRAN